MTLPLAGIAVPSGFFVPQLLVGATLGRLFCEVLINAGWPTYFGQVSGCDRNDALAAVRTRREIE